MPDTKTLYDNLISSGKVSPNEIGDFNTFTEQTKDAESAKKLYTNLKTKAGFTEDDLGDESTFMNLLGSQSAPATTSQTAQTSASPTSPAPVSAEPINPGLSTIATPAPDLKAAIPGFPKPKEELNFAEAPVLGATNAPGVAGKTMADLSLTPKPAPGSLESFVEPAITHTGGATISAPKPETSYLENVGNAFMSSGKSALLDVGTAVENQALTVNNLIGKVAPTFAAESEKRIKGNLIDIQSAKDLNSKLTGKPGETLGAMVPFVGMAAASMLAKSPYLASATTGMFAEMGVGTGIDAYDQYTKENNLPTDDWKRAGAGLLTGIVMSAPIGDYLGGAYLGKLGSNLVKNSMGKALELNPEFTATLGKDILENFAKQSPALATRLAGDLTKSAIHGTMSMSAMELGKKAVDQYFIGKDTTSDEWLSTLAGAAKSGVTFGLLTAPFAAYAQSQANTARREQQGTVTMGLDKKTGKAFEIVTDKDGNNFGLTPDGNSIKVTPDQVKESFTMTTDDFNNALSQYKQTGEIDPNVERSAYSGRIKQALKTIAPKGIAVVYTAGDGSNYYLTGKDSKTGRVIALDSNGQRVSLDAEAATKVKAVPAEQIHDTFLSQYDAAKQRYDYEQNRAQAARTVKENFDRLAQADGLLHVGYMSDANGADQEVIIAGTTPEGASILSDGRLVESKDIKDIQEHPFASLFESQISQFDAENNPDLLNPIQAQSTFNWNGKDMQVADVLDPSRILVQEVDKSGEPIGRPEEMSSDDYRAILKQQVANPGETPALRTYQIGGNTYNFIKDANGDYQIENPVQSEEEANALAQQMQGQLGEGVTARIVPIESTDATLPNRFNVVLQTPGILDQLPEEPSLEDQLLTEPKTYMRNGEAIPQNKVEALVRNAILTGNKSKLQGLDLSGDPKLMADLQKAFPPVYKLGKKVITKQDALDHIYISDTPEELAQLKIDNIASDPDIEKAYAEKIKELNPEVTDKDITDQLFAEEPQKDITEQLFTKETVPLKTKENVSTNESRVASTEPRGEAIEQTEPNRTRGQETVTASGNVQGDGQGGTGERTRAGAGKPKSETEGEKALVEDKGLIAHTPEEAVKLYRERLTKLKAEDPGLYWSVDLPSDAELLSAAKGGRLVDANGGMALVSKDGNLEGLFKYDSTKKGTAKTLQALRVKLGGNKLDAYDTKALGRTDLISTYKKDGFREVARVDFNPDVAPKDMPEEVKVSKPDVVVMIYDPDNKLSIKERRFNKDQYSEALDYRDSYLTPEPKPEHNKSADTQAFFSDVVTGKSDKFKPKKKWEPLMSFTPEQEAVRKVYEKFNGNFDEHIATSIPGFRDIQIKTISAIEDIMTGKEGLLYDIGGSEGGFAKTVTSLSDGKIKTINLDANGDMEKVHNATPVEGSKFVKEAFGEAFDWDGEHYKSHKPEHKADVVHESMTFQFIDEKRADKLDEVLASYLKPDGLFITEEKVHPKSQEQWLANEAKKDKDFKAKYYEPSQISAKKEEVLTGMATNQTTAQRYKSELQKRFDNVAEYWDSGNFKGFVASNDKAKVDAFLKSVGNTDTEFSEKNINPDDFKPTNGGGGKPKKSFGFESLFEEKPVSASPSLKERIKQAADATDLNPTQKQIEAGNYKKGHLNLQGLSLSIENPKGSIRKGIGQNGKPWETKMTDHYGYFNTTIGADGDQIDFFLGNHPESEKVFVVDQINPGTKAFDESKVMLGYTDIASAKQAYLANHDKNWKGFGGITEAPMPFFKKWLYDGARQRKPFADYKDVVELPKRLVVVKGTKGNVKDILTDLETQAQFKTDVHILNNAETANRISLMGYPKEWVDDVRAQDWYGYQVDDNIFIHIDCDPAEALVTWLHEKDHAYFDSQFSNVADQKEYCRRLLARIGTAEFNRVVPTIYKNESTINKIKEYLAFLAEDVLTGEGLLNEAPSYIKSMMQSHISSIIPLKNLENVKQSVIELTTGRKESTYASIAAGRGLQTVTGISGAPESASGRSLQSTPGGTKEIDLWDQLFQPGTGTIKLQAFKRKPQLQVNKKQISTAAERIQELLINNKLALENWMADVGTVIPKIEDYENPLLKDALAKSKVTTKLTNFDKSHYEPLVKSIAAITKIPGVKLSDLSHYAIAQHGLERNEHFWALKPEQTGKDFSGLTELKDLAIENATEAEKAMLEAMPITDFAKYEIKKFEDKVGAEKVKEFWKSIDDIAKTIRDEMLDSGMISKDYYNELNSMYRHYIPLRSWENNNPEAFEFSRGVGDYTAPIVHAKGRRSLSDDPISTLLQMANTAYVSGERNRVKRAAGMLVRNNKSELKDVVQYKKVYFIDSGTDAQGNPIITETIDRPADELFETGKVLTKTPKDYTARKVPAQAKEFEVEFYENGNKYVLVFQGSDPAVARAINNKEASVGLDYLNKAVTTPIKIGSVTIPSISSMSRYLSAINTTYAIAFPLVNFVRDVPVAVLTDYVEGDAKQALRLFPKMKLAEGALRRYLSEKTDLTKPEDQALQDFFRYGAPTGFAYLKDVDEFKKTINKDVRAINDIKNPIVRAEVGFKKSLEYVGKLGEWSEGITRFAVYMNSLDQGDSKEQAALAAKKATVNFDQKGRASTALNAIYVFFNAAMQGVDKYFKLWGRNWKKMAGVHVALLAQGFLGALMLDLFSNEDEEGVKGYDKVSDFTKRNNVVIPIPGTNAVASLPISQIYRQFYSMGFDAYELMTHRKSVTDVLSSQLANIPSDLTPIDTGGFLDKNKDVSIRPLVPSILRPIMELQVNENFMNALIVPEPFSLTEAKKIADTRRAYKDVNKTAQWLTDELYKLGGGDETGFKYIYDNGQLKEIPALLDISPESIEFLFESYFGGVGKFVNQTWKTAGNIVNMGKSLATDDDLKKALKEVDVNTVPVVNRFIRTPMGDPLQNEFRQVRNDFEKKIIILNQAIKEGNNEKAALIYSQIYEKLESYKAIMTTFEGLDAEYTKLQKVAPEDAKYLETDMRKLMQQVIELNKK